MRVEVISTFYSGTMGLEMSLSIFVINIDDSTQLAVSFSA